MTAAELLATWIAKNREIDQRVRRESSTFSLDQIVNRLDARKQRAFYGAVAGSLACLV